MWTSFTSTPVYNKAAFRYPASGGLGEVEIAIHITAYHPESINAQVTNTTTGANVDTFSNLSSGGTVASLAANELPKIILEGFIDTPYTITPGTSAGTLGLYPGQTIFPNNPVPLSPKQPVQGDRGGGTSSFQSNVVVGGISMTYGDLMASYFEGRTGNNSPWMSVNPKWFRDSYGRIFNNPRVTALAMQYVEAVPNRIQVQMTLQV